MVRLERTVLASGCIILSLLYRRFNTRGKKQTRKEHEKLQTLWLSDIIVMQFTVGMNNTLNPTPLFLTSTCIGDPLWFKFETIERYQRHTKDVHTNSYRTSEHNMQHLKHEAANMAKKIELLEISKRKLLGEGLGSCSLEELQQIEQQLERSVSCIRARKNQVFKEQIDQLKEKEKVLAAENAMLCEKCGVQRSPIRENNEVLPCAERSQNSDVETELFIGLPDGRGTRLLLGN